MIPMREFHAPECRLHPLNSVQPRIFPRNFHARGSYTQFPFLEPRKVRDETYSSFFGDEWNCASSEVLFNHAPCFRLLVNGNKNAGGNQALTRSPSRLTDGGDASLIPLHADKQ
jgi:hypothetical protein